MGNTIKNGLNLTIGEIAKVTGGLLNEGEDVVIDSISTDSRSIKKGELFVVIEGENFDGHKFVQAALKKGAAGAIVKKGYEVDEGMTKQNIFIEVEDTLNAYQDVAKHVRLKNDAKVVAITGSSGKTTTKEMVKNILKSKKEAVLVSEKNFNNYVGVPMTLLKLKKNHKIAVLEIGINEVNEMDRLANITNPDIALVTNAGSSHLEKLINVDTVAYEKMKLANGLKDNGLLIFNCDDLRLLRHARTKKNKTLKFGFSKSADIVGESFEDLKLNKSRLTVKIDKKPAVTIDLKINGKHNAYNVLAAIAIAKSLKVPMRDIIKGLKSFKPKDMRFENVRLKRDIVLINDAYNANPDSMTAALYLVNGLTGTKRKIAVLGDMYELGGYSERAHKEVGAIVADLKYEHVFFYGDDMKHAAKSAGYSGLDKKKIHWSNDLDTLFEALYAELEDGDWILLKGSRLNKLEVIAEKLIDKIGINGKLASR
jgi:UDP-N-acetylmuramoyl-tripeptide--D-alanyl-D-alanine ligase